MKRALDGPLICEAVSVEGDVCELDKGHGGMHQTYDVAWGLPQLAQRDSVVWRKPAVDTDEIMDSENDPATALTVRGPAETC